MRVPCPKVICTTCTTLHPLGAAPAPVYLTSVLALVLVLVGRSIQGIVADDHFPTFSCQWMFVELAQRITCLGSTLEFRDRQSRGCRVLKSTNPWDPWGQTPPLTPSRIS